MGLKTTFLNHMKDHTANMESLEQKIAVIQGNEDISESRKQAMIDQARQDHSAATDQIRTAALELLDGKKAEVFRSDLASKPIEYQTQLANTIKICELTAGLLLTSDIVQLCKPFERDQIAVNAIRAALEAGGVTNHEYMDLIPQDHRTATAGLIDELSAFVSRNVHPDAPWTGMSGGNVALVMTERYVLSQLDENLNMIVGGGENNE